MKTKKIVATAVFGMLILSQLALFAQAGPPGPSAAPIDGGAILLVAGIAAYGYRKIREAGDKPQG